MIDSIEAYSNWRKNTLSTNSLTPADWRNIIDVVKKVGIGALAAGAVYGIFKLYKYLNATESANDTVDQLVNATLDAFPLFESLKSKIPNEDSEKYSKALDLIQTDLGATLSGIQRRGGVAKDDIEHLSAMLDTMLGWFSKYDQDSFIKLARDYSIIKVNR